MPTVFFFPSLLLSSHIPLLPKFEQIQACVARLGPSPNGFVINLYFSENGEQVCTCCRECEGVRYVGRWVIGGSLSLTVPYSVLFRVLYFLAPQQLTSSPTIL